MLIKNNVVKYKQSHIVPPPPGRFAMSQRKLDPEEWMPVTFVPAELVPWNLKGIHQDLVDTYGRGYFVVLSKEAFTGGDFAVTLLHNGEPLRRPWNKEDGLEPHGWEGEIRKIHWSLLRPMV